MNLFDTRDELEFSGYKNTSRAYRSSRISTPWRPILQFISHQGSSLASEIKTWHETHLTKTKLTVKELIWHRRGKCMILLNFNMDQYRCLYHPSCCLSRLSCYHVYSSLFLLKNSQNTSLFIFVVFHSAKCAICVAFQRHVIYIIHVRRLHAAGQKIYKL